ncbi:mRNA-binding ribosome synthesis protein nop7 [Phlyctochytrium bullatum]|nr:mRNA-binding ribosome synthesis protein nop7 [Phlyctochytrium bullatum]
MGKKLKKGDRGSATNYITRTQAVRKLQLTLADFRRICILKGVYPHEPKNKKKVGKGSTAPRTYYYKKDIQYLLHEPILTKFREIRAHQRKLFKAITKREWEVAKSLQAQTPTYTLDHVIKERYPRFTDALRDLDDALSMVFLFASLPSDTIIKPSRIRNCQKLASEFQHYVMASRSLTKVFLTIKGIYYQARIHGEDITWIVPFQFSMEVPADVDLKIMSTFLELHETLLKFVNYKLYTSMNLVYPPKVDESKEGQGAGLASYVIESTDGKALLDNLSAAQPGAAEKKQSKKKALKRLKSLGAKLGSIEAHQDEDEEEAEGDEDAEAEDDAAEEDAGVPKMVAEPTDASEKIPSLDDEGIEDTDKTRNLFKDLVFFLSREVPRTSLEFVIRAFGGKVAWDESSGSGSEFRVDDPRITHQIVDRPIDMAAVAPGEDKMDVDGEAPAAATVYPNREYLQPQWVYDCINAKKLVKTESYHPGDTLPPHLSPFGSDIGYDPTEALENDEAEEKAGTAGEDAEAAEGEEESEDEEAEGEEEEEEDDEEDNEEDLVYKAELEAEAAGLTFSEYIDKKAKEEAEAAAEKKGKKGAKQQPKQPEQQGSKKRKLTPAEEAAVEEKELAKMMMSKKDRRLYEQIEYGKKKKQAEIDELRQLRKEAEQMAKKQKLEANKPAKVAAEPAKEAAPAKEVGKKKDEPKQDKKKEQEKKNDATPAPQQQGKGGKGGKKDAEGSKKDEAKAPEATPQPQPQQQGNKKAKGTPPAAAETPAKGAKGDKNASRKPDTSKQQPNGDAAKSKPAPAEKAKSKSSPAEKFTPKSAAETNGSAESETAGDSPSATKKHVKWAGKGELRKVAEYDKFESPVNGIRQLSPAEQEAAMTKKKPGKVEALKALLNQKRKAVLVGSSGAGSSKLLKAVKKVVKGKVLGGVGKKSKAAGGFVVKKKGA